jgi:hypothetical protein
MWYMFSGFGILHQEKSGNPAQRGMPLTHPVVASEMKYSFIEVL